MPRRVKQSAQAWEALLRAQAHLMKQFEQAGDFQPLSAREYDVLFTLVSSDGRLPMKDLVDNALVSQPSLSRMVDRLMAKGLVKRVANTQDRRAIDVEITQEGRAMQREIGRKHVRTIAQQLRPLSNQELDQLTALCTKLRKESE